MTDDRPSRLPRLPDPPAGGYFDASSTLGEWPSRRLNGSPPPSPTELVARRIVHMDRLGIRRAAVSSLDAVWLKDSSVANAELHALVRGHTDRFLPLYTLNPIFPSAADHLKRCTDEHGLAAGHGAIRLYPGYHVYALDDPRVDACLERIASIGVPVMLTMQLEDARLHQPAMRVPDLLVPDVLALCARWPAIRWIVSGARFAEAQGIGRQLPPDAQVWIELSRVQGPVDAIPTLCRAAGAQRLLFGTNTPLHLPEAAILELADARLSPEDDAAIRYQNAARALALTHT
ncbi:MAG TPA: amidohydrolase family protein [Chloroflexota bacterium]|nr:amidohydrolase family protein [Chloroflexota bacterium]